MFVYVCVYVCMCLATVWGDKDFVSVGGEHQQVGVYVCVCLCVCMYVCMCVLRRSGVIRTL